MQTNLEIDVFSFARFLSVSYGDINRIAAEKNMEYEDVIKELNQASGKRLVIPDVGFSSSCGFGSSPATTEKSQGQQTVSVLKATDKEGVICAIVADLNDDWSAVSNEMYPFTVPFENNCLWQNVADPTQTSGLVAFDAEVQENAGINLADDDRIQMLSLSANEGYLYITAQFLGEIDYKAEQLFIGIDISQLKATHLKYDFVTLFGEYLPCSSAFWKSRE